MLFAQLLTAARVSLNMRRSVMPGLREVDEIHPRHHQGTAVVAVVVADEGVVVGVVVAEVGTVVGVVVAGVVVGVVEPVKPLMSMYQLPLTSVHGAVVDPFVPLAAVYASLKVPAPGGSPAFGSLLLEHEIVVVDSSSS